MRFSRTRLSDIGDTTVNDDLIALAQAADILVHRVADLAYLERHGITGAASTNHQTRRGREPTPPAGAAPQCLMLALGFPILAPA